jgi:hypothetical protein
MTRALDGARSRQQGGRNLEEARRVAVEGNRELMQQAPEGTAGPEDRGPNRSGEVRQRDGDHSVFYDRTSGTDAEEDFAEVIFPVQLLPQHVDRQFAPVVAREG